METLSASETGLNPETLEQIRLQVSTLKSSGMTWLQIGHALTQAGLMERHLKSVHPSLGIEMGKPSREKTLPRQDAVSLLTDVADCMGSLRKQLQDVKPKHYGVLAQMEALEIRCRNATRE